MTKNTTTLPQKHNHTTQTPPQKHHPTTPPQKHHPTTPPQKHHHKEHHKNTTKNATTKSPPQEHHHKNTKNTTTPPQKHHPTTPRELERKQAQSPQTQKKKKCPKKKEKNSQNKSAPYSWPIQASSLHSANLKRPSERPSKAIVVFKSSKKTKMFAMKTGVLKSPPCCSSPLRIPSLWGEFLFLPTEWLRLCFLWTERMRRGREPSRTPSRARRPVWNKSRKTVTWNWNSWRRRESLRRSFNSRSEWNQVQRPSKTSGCSVNSGTRSLGLQELSGNSALCWFQAAWFSVWRFQLDSVCTIVLWCFVSQLLKWHVLLSRPLLIEGFHGWQICKSIAQNCLWRRDPFTSDPSQLTTWVLTVSNIHPGTI